jgi:transcriptional regulator with XRE-family HTH domain
VTVRIEVDPAAFVRWLRVVTGYSQDDLAALIGLGKGGRTMISYWETGARQPTADQWNQLLQVRPYLAHSISGDKTAGSFLRVVKDQPQGLGPSEWNR